MVQLTPTVHERLARCATTVRLSGLVAGATVEIDVAGALQQFIATGGVSYQAVPPLNADEIVRARQNTGDGFTPFSPGVVVEDAAVPPVSAPLLPSQVGRCSHCIRVDGLVPGSTVELFHETPVIGTTIVGSGEANRHGWTCVELPTAPFRETLSARAIVCGVEGPTASTPVVDDEGLPAPNVQEPLFGCQSVVPLSNLHLGARTRIDTQTGTFLGWICNCWTAPTVNVLHPL